MWETVSVPLGIQQSLDDIFSAVLMGGIDRKDSNNETLLENKISAFKVCRPKFLGQFPINVFNNEYALFYEIMVTMNVKVFSIDQIESIVDNNRDLILDSPYVRKADFVAGDNKIPNDDDIINAMINNMKRKLKELSMQYISVEEFESASVMYKDWYKNQLMFYTSNNMTAIMSDIGFEERLPHKRRRKYHGIEDAMEYYRKNVDIINSLSDERRVRSTLIDEKWLEDDLQKMYSGDNRKDLMNIGLHEIDDVMGKLKRGNMLGIVGATKGGKTRFTNYLVQRALSLGLNVCVWVMEGTKEEWMDCQTASFIARVSAEERKRKGTGNIYRVSSGDIAENRFRNAPEMMKLIASAKATMATSEKMGRLSFMEATPYIETYIDEVDNHYNNVNPFDVLVVDSLVNMQSLNGMGRVERISAAYMNTKQYITNQIPVPALCIATAQLKQETIDFLRRNPDETMDVTAGGESAETIRTPDFTVGLFSTKEERNADHMKMYCVASRHSASFDDFIARCYLDCCHFMSEDEDV